LNVFILSPGRTATTTLAHAFDCVEGYSSLHQCRCRRLGEGRVDYPESHIECDNRLTWFLPRLTKKYGANGILVVVDRDRSKTAASYNRRWERINIMKAYSQGILMRKFEDNTYDVCVDYVSNVYEQLDYFSSDWKYVINLQLESPDAGVSEILSVLKREEHKQEVLSVLSNVVLNLNKLKGLKRRYKVFRYNLECLMKDLRA